MAINALVSVQSIGGDMQFTIIRPGGLKTQPATGRGVLTEDVNVCGAIHREDVADLLVHALFSDKATNKVRQLLAWLGSSDTANTRIPGLSLNSQLVPSVQPLRLSPQEWDDAMLCLLCRRVACDALCACLVRHYCCWV